MSIVVTKALGFYPDQKKRLDALGDVTYYDHESSSSEEWYERCKDSDIICTGRVGLDSDQVFMLKDVFISLPFVGVDFLDLEKLRLHNITIANAPGCNKEAVVEYIVGMLLMRFRKLNEVIKPEVRSGNNILETGLSIWSKNITILGAGNIGRHLKNVVDAFKAHVTIFKRGDGLLDSVKDADVIVNCLAVNETTAGLLNREFFQSLKKGAFFVSVARPQIYDVDALIEALDSGHLAGAIDDIANATVGDTEDELYKKLHAHPKILATPHLAWNSESEARKSNDIMIDNIEAWIKGEPQNVLNA